jgi:hypothetical protein
MTAQEKLSKWAQRIHHLGMRYVGAVAEVARGKPILFLGVGEPGVHEIRDLISLILLQRGEINALTKLLVEKKVFTEEEFTKEVADQYEWWVNEKAKQFGIEVTDFGITIKGPK